MSRKPSLMPNRKSSPKVWVAWSAICIVLSPCILILLTILGPLAIVKKVKSKFLAIKAERVRKAHELKAAPRLRKRALTLPLPEEAYKRGVEKSLGVRKSRQSTFNQRQCLLITKLPIELRTEIWRLVLGYTTVEIKPWCGHVAQPRRPPHWWAIVKTCRMVYSESIDLLYSTAHFYINGGWENDGMLFVLKASVLPHRWVQIQRLTFQHLFAPIMNSSRQGCVVTRTYSGKFIGLEGWVANCAIIKQMNWLKMLRIIVDDPHCCVGPEILEKLRGLAVRRLIRVQADWHLGDSVVERLQRELNVDFETRSSQGMSGQSVELAL